MKKCFYESELTPDLHAPRHARELLTPILKSSRLGQEVCNGLLLGISEVLVNLVKHSDPTPTRVGLKILTVVDSIVIEIEDNGGCFEGFYEYTRQSDITLGENGMGLALLTTYCPDVEYISGPPNVVRLTLQAKKPAHIVLIDDDQTQRRILKHYLSDRYEVTECASVNEALELIDTERPDLIVSDLCMPEKTGIDLCKILHGRKTTELIPLIFLSGRQNEFLLSELFRSPIDAFLSKPVSKLDLIDEIERVLNRTSFVRDRLGNRLEQDISSLLEPQLPTKIGSWNCTVQSKPASAGGGDVVLHHPSDQGHLILFADLMGHGEQAKFFSHVLVGYMHGLLAGSTSVQSPGKILDALSATMASDKILSRTILTAQAIFLSDEGQVVVASGGHPFPFLDDKALTISGPLPGLMPDTEYQEHAFSVSKGQKLILYSDGVLENRTDGTLDAAISGTSSLPIHEMALAVIEGCDKRDDATIAILEYANEP